MIELLGWAATVLCAVYAVPQVVRMLRTKSVGDLSPWMWWLYLVGHVLALAYAVALAHPPLVAKYAVNVLTGGAVLVIYYRTRYA